MYNYYANAGFLENAKNSIKQYAPMLFIGGAGLFIAMMFGPDKFGNLGGGNLIPLLAIGLMAIGGYVTFSNTLHPVTAAAPPPASPPSTHTKAKYAYYY
jgi:hypothetical protein